MTPKRLLLIVAIIAGGLATAAKPASAQDRQYKLKADWMYHFGNSLVDWGKSKHKDFVIGVLGGDPRDLNAQLARIKRLAGRIDGRTIKIEQFTSMRDYKRCDILFISSVPVSGRKETAATRLNDALNNAEIKRGGVLIVSESSGFAGRGSMINFAVDPARNRLTMQINPGAAKRAGLKLKGKLTASRAVTETVETTSTNN